MKSFYVSIQNVANNQDINATYPIIKPQKIYYGTDNGFIKIKEAYFSINNKAKTVFSLVEGSYIGIYVNSIDKIEFDKVEYPGSLINTADSKGYIWKYGSNIGATNSYFYLYKNCYNFFCANDTNLCNIENLKFNYVTNLNKFAYNRPGITGNLSKLNLLNVITANNAFYNCRNIIGNPAHMPKAIDIVRSYMYCINITGNPYCEDNVIYGSYAYFECRNLTGIAACGNNIVTMDAMYYNCYNINENIPTCPQTTSNLYNCYNLSKFDKKAILENFHFYGSDIRECFNHRNTEGNLYLHNSSVLPSYCFYARSTFSSYNRLNIYIRSSLSARDTGNIMFDRTTITWYQGAGGVYNTLRNVYIYNTLTS